MTRCRLSSAAGALAGALPPLFLATMGYSRRWVSEDAFIDLRVVHNLLDGHGPVFNTIERVEAYTNPLWVALLTLWGALGGPLEIGAVSLGLVLSIAGVLAAQAGAWTLASRLDDEDAGVGRGSWAGRVRLPLGAAVFAAIPVVWDFVTSGLEIGLVLAWLGGVFWFLARSRPMTLRATRVAAFAIGLGPLIRPDLAIYSVAFFLALVVAASRAPGHGAAWRVWVGLGLVALAVPLTYQVFRMGYFAALVPNTALAKEAGAAYWRQGWRYAVDFFGTYALWAPLLLLLPWWAVLVRRAWQARDRSSAALLLAPLLAAVAHSAYVTRVGGDFMHGRLLLPALFALLLPLASVILPLSVRPPWGVFAAAGVVAWAVVCAVWLRVPYRGEIGPWGIADERGFYTRRGRANPIVARDYDWTPLVRGGMYMRGRDRVLVIDRKRDEELPLRATVPQSTRAVVALQNIGILGYVAGSSVHVVDRHGLADPIGSRMRLPERGRPGHEKMLPEAWIAARFADPRVAALAYPAAPAAAAALGCGPVAALLRAVEEPLTPGLFFSNLRMSWALHGLRIPAEPAAARAELCARGSLVEPAG